MALSQEQDLFIDWLLMPKDARTVRTQAELAANLGVGESTLTAWKKDPEFARAWEARYYEGVGDPERRSEIMDTLYETAVDREDPKHVQAARAYMDLVEEKRPQLDDSASLRPLSELSDDELAELTRMATNDELAKRRAG